MKIKSTATVILLVATFGVAGQKVKYKDLFPLLNTKNWEQGGAQLKAYLSDPANVKDKGYPNANLQMALWLEERFNAMDIASDTVAGYNVGDSAIYFFGNAKALINEKEIKKNDAYYQAFFRRDLRTGEFGIKESDVHLDIEKKIEAIQNKMTISRDLGSKAESVDDGNQKLEEKYKKLADRYRNYNELLIAADAEAITTLQEIKTEAFEVKKNAQEVKKIASGLKTEKFSREVQLKEIKSFGTDGISSVSVANGVIEMWDYEGWATKTTSEINGPVAQLKSMTLSYSKSIREKKNLIKKNQNAEVDSMSAELSNLFDTYDSESVARKLLLTEASEVRIMKLNNYSLNKSLLDSSLVASQLETFEKVLKEATEMSLVVSSINAEELEAAKSTYKDYIDSFFQPYTTAGSYVTEMKTWSQRQKTWASDAVEYWTERNRWGIVTIEGEGDKKIPLFIQDAPENEYFTLGIPLNSNDEVVVFGANISDKKGFVYSFDQGRYTKWGLEYDLPGDGNFKLESDTIAAAEGSTSFFLMNNEVQENNMSVVSFTNQGALNWSSVITVSKAPVGFKFDDITQELTILLYPEEELPLDNGEQGYIVIDKTGNAR